MTEVETTNQTVHANVAVAVGELKSDIDKNQRADQWARTVIREIASGTREVTDQYLSVRLCSEIAFKELAENRAEGLTAPDYVRYAVSKVFGRGKKERYNALVRQYVYRMAIMYCVMHDVAHE